MEKKQKKMIIGIILGIIILELVLFGVLKLISNQTGNNQGNNQNGSKAVGLALDDFYSSASCKCLERNNLRCENSSWQLDAKNRICKSGKTITSVVLGCSQYVCNGTTYDFNNNTNKWEVK